MVTFYPLIIFFALISIRNKKKGMLYNKISKKDAHTRLDTIMNHTYKQAILRLHLKSLALSNHHMPNNPKSKIILSKDKFRNSRPSSSSSSSTQLFASLATWLLKSYWNKIVKYLYSQHETLKHLCR